MALDLSTLTDYAWADIKKAAKAAMVSAALGGQTLVINGRTIGRITITEAKKLYEMAQEMETTETAAETGGGIVLVKYGERV